MKINETMYWNPNETKTKIHLELGSKLVSYISFGGVFRITQNPGDFLIEIINTYMLETYRISYLLLFPFSVGQERENRRREFLRDIRR